MAAYAQDIVKQAQSWLGCNENNGSHKAIIDVYNSFKPLPRGYKVQYTDAWCATFVSAVAIKCGATDIIPRECGCEQMINLFKKIGCWIEDESITPTPGMIIFYDWQDNGIGDNRGYSDHVGIVEAVSGNSMTIIEGNMSNAVGRRTLKVNAKYIRGYGAPKYKTTKLKIGDKVKLTADATYYDGKAIPGWVKSSVLYVRRISGDRAVISVFSEGDITGAVNIKHLKLV